MSRGNSFNLSGGEEEAGLYQLMLQGYPGPAQPCDQCLTAHKDLTWLTLAYLVESAPTASVPKTQTDESTDVIHIPPHHRNPTLSELQRD